MFPLVEKLALRFGYTFDPTSRADNPSAVKGVAARLGFVGNETKVRRDARHRMGGGAKTLQLRVLRVPASATEQHCLREEGFAP